MSDSKRKTQTFSLVRQTNRIIMMVQTVFTCSPNPGTAYHLCRSVKGLSISQSLSSMQTYFSRVAKGQVFVL